MILDLSGETMNKPVCALTSNLTVLGPIRPSLSSVDFSAQAYLDNVSSTKTFAVSKLSEVLPKKGIIAKRLVNT